MEPAILLLTGESGAGKSTVCLRAAAQAREQGLPVAGVVTLTATDRRREVMDAGTGRRRLLARRGGSASGPCTRDWGFSARGLSWGASLLRRSGPRGLLLVDELGPLELLRGQGWIVALDVLRAGHYGLAVVVVRPELLTCLQERLAGLPVDILTVTVASRDALAGQIVSRLGGRA